MCLSWDSCGSSPRATNGLIARRYCIAFWKLSLNKTMHTVCTHHAVNTYTANAHRRTHKHPKYEHRNFKRSGDGVTFPNIVIIRRCRRRGTSGWIPDTAKAEPSSVPAFSRPTKPRRTASGPARQNYWGFALALVHGNCPLNIPQLCPLLMPLFVSVEALDDVIVRNPLSGCVREFPASDNIQRDEVVGSRGRVRDRLSGKPFLSQQGYPGAFPRLWYPVLVRWFPKVFLASLGQV